MTQTHCGEAEFVNHRIVRWAPGATQGSVAAGKEVEGVVTGDGVDGPVHELTVERYVRGCFPTSSLSPPPFRFSRAMDKERSHTGAASLSTTFNSGIPLYQPFPSLFLLLLILLHFPPLPAKSGLSAY